MNSQEIQDMNQEYVLGTYTPVIAIAEGKGARIKDAEGNEFLDFVSGISVCNLGHCHPKVNAALKEQADKLWHVSNLYVNPVAPQLAKKISDASFGGRVFFANSGAEANEAMIKFARRWGWKNGGRNEIICMNDSFHGRTLATLGATGRAKYREGFEPNVDGFKHVDYNSIDAIADAYTENTVAVMMEPVLGEGGVIPADPEFLKEVREFCNEKKILLLFDEVQTGIGRTGKMFAHQHSGVVPDVMSTAKALANGFPLGAIVVRRDCNDVLVPGTHATTFGGNALGCAAGLAVFEAFEEENILEHSAGISKLIFARLAKMAESYDFIKELRGQGMMIGIALSIAPGPFVAAARDKGLLILTAGEDALRLLPALNLTEEEANEGLDILESLFAEEAKK